jgi:hypothetical protein
MRVPALRPRAVFTALAVLVLVGLVALAWWVLPSVRLPTLLVLGGATFVGFVAACVLVVPAWLVARDTTVGALTPEQLVSAKNGIRTTLIQGVVGLTALAGIAVGWQQLQTDRQQLQDQLALTRQGQVAERFTRAVDQLGSNALDVRLGGIYGLEQIAQQSPEDRLQVFEVLTAYIRQHTRRRQETGAFGVRSSRARCASGPDGARPPGRVQGRPIVGSARSGPARKGGPPCRQPAAGQPQFRQSAGANLGTANLEGAILDNANLQKVSFDTANLQGAFLVGANLKAADLWKANLQRAHLLGADLQEASVAGKANLRDANLWRANLRKADLSFADLQKADLRYANLQEARVDRAHMQNARANRETAWPSGFDWSAAGVELE